MYFPIIIYKGDGSDTSFSSILKAFIGLTINNGDDTKKKCFIFIFIFPYDQPVFTDREM